MVGVCPPAKMMKTRTMMMIREMVCARNTYGTNTYRYWLRR